MYESDGLKKNPCKIQSVLQYLPGVAFDIVNGLTIVINIFLVYFSMHTYIHALNQDNS